MGLLPPQFLTAYIRQKPMIMRRQRTPTTTPKMIHSFSMEAAVDSLNSQIIVAKQGWRYLGIT